MRFNNTRFVPTDPLMEDRYQVPPTRWERLAIAVVWLASVAFVLACGVILYMKVGG